MGQCLLAGWTEKQFWRSSYRAVSNLIYTLSKREEKASRERWEQTRIICQHIVAPYRKKGSEKQAVFAFHWDNEMQKPSRELTEAEKAAQDAKFAKWDAEMKAKYSNGKE